MWAVFRKAMLHLEGERMEKSIALLGSRAECRGEYSWNGEGFVESDKKSVQKLTNCLIDIGVTPSITLKLQTRV